MMNNTAPLPPLPPPHATLDDNTPDRNPWIRSFCKTAVKRLQLLTSQSAVTTRGVSPSTTTTSCSTSSSCTTHNAKDQYNRATAKDIRATYSAYELSSAEEEATSDFHMPISSSTTTSGLSDALRRLTSTTSISRGLAALSSEKSCGKHLWLSRFNKKQISVFLKTPHVVAGSVMSGTIAIDMTLCNTFDMLNPHTLPFKSLVLELHGIERMLYYYYTL